MPAIETIIAATIETAKLLGESDTLGSISVGKIADIIAISGNPLEDMNDMQNVDFVMKNGKVYFNKVN